MEHNKIDDNIVEKKVFIFSIFLLGLIIVLSIVICYFLLSNKLLNIKNEPQDTMIEVNKPVDEIVSEAVQYEVKSYNGKIGIFKNNSLVYTLDTYVFTLPESDKELLKRGIILTNINDLKRLIEEYA
jgi:hypothetical protein